MTKTTPHLTHLESTGLIRLAQTQPELEYLFRHALVQDAAYESLLLADRKRLHKEVAQTLEHLYPNRLDELAPVLGHHFALAEDKPHALKYFTLAGDVAFALSANTEAITHYSRAIEIAAGQTTFSAERLIHLFTRRGRAMELTGRFAEAEANYQVLEGLADKANEPALALAGLMARATIYAIPSPTFDPDQGETLCQQALELAQQLADRPAEAKILWNLMLLRFFTSQTDEGLAYGQAALKLARTYDLKEQLAYILNDLAGYCYLPGGQYEQGQATLHEARIIWQELGNRAMLADNLATGAFNLFLYGDFVQSHALSSEAYQLNRTIANLWGQAYSHALTAMVEMEWGQSAQAITTFVESIALADEAGFLAGHVIAGGLLAVEYATLGDFERALPLAQQMVTLAEDQIGFWQPHAVGSLALVYIRQGNLTLASETLAPIESVIFEPDRFAMSFVMALLAQCELELAQKDYQQVIILLEQQVPDLQHRQMNTYLPYLLYYQGRAFLGHNQPTQARAVLSKACTLAKKLGSKHSLWPILISLSQLEVDPTTAQHLHQQAQAIVEDLIDHIPPDLRTSFRNLPEVKAVLQAKDPRRQD